jgi:hypothetical protein
VTCEVESTDVSPPIADAGLKDVASALIMVGGVSFPGALRAPCDSFTTFPVPALVALLCVTILPPFFHFSHSRDVTCH